MLVLTGLNACAKFRRRLGQTVRLTFGLATMAPSAAGYETAGRLSLQQHPQTARTDPRLGPCKPVSSPPNGSHHPVRAIQIACRL